MAIMGEDLRNVFEQQEVKIPDHIRRATSSRGDGRVFAELLESPILPETDKYMRRLAGEGFTLLVAGTETTAATLSYIVYHLLSEPIMVKRLQAALEGIGVYLTAGWPLAT